MPILWLGAIRLMLKWRRYLGSASKHLCKEWESNMNSTRHDTDVDREAIAETANPIGLNGIEFIEYLTSKPQALGQVLEMMGFRPIAHHRSREVTLYRQGDINL